MASQDEQADPAFAHTLTGATPPPRAIEELAPDTVLGGRYRIMGFLGRGGMGAVYRALDEALATEVALKLVGGGDKDGTRGLDRLRDEVRLAQRVTHANVCRTYDLEEVDGRWLVKMELVAGEELSARVARGSLPIGEVVAIARQIAEGLAAAHEKGVVHRDLKPHNVIVEPEGRVVLMDFGLARAARGGGLEVVAGTPAYMAPEQLTGVPTDARVDLYALGCVIYEMLAGAVPLPATSLGEAHRHRRDRPRDVRTRRPDTPAWLGRLVAQLLEKDPAQRPADARAVLRALTPPRRRQRVLTAAVGATAVIGVAAGVWQITHPRPWRPEVVDILPIVDENADWPAVSPDGKLLAFTSDRGDGVQQRLYVQPLPGGAPRQIDLGGLTVHTVRWARDGQGLFASVLDQSHLKIFRVPLDGGAPKLVGEDKLLLEDCGASGLVYQRTDDREVIADGPAGPRRLFHVSPKQSLFGFRCDGAGKIAVLSLGPRRSSRPTVELYAYDMAVGTQHRLAEKDTVVRSATVTPDGRSVVYPARVDGRINLYERPIAGGPARRLTFGEGPDLSPDVGFDGQVLVFDVDQTAIPPFALSLRGGSPRRLSSDLEEYTVQGATADEVIAAITGEPNRLVAMPVAGGVPRRIADGDYAALAPGGKELYYASENRIFAIPVAGGEPRALGEAPAQVVGIAVGDDDVYLRLTMGDTRRVARLPRAGGAAELVTPETILYVIPAPTGKRLLVIQSGFEAFVVEPGEPLDARTRPIGKSFSFAWAPDGQSVFVTSANGVARVTLDGKKTRVLDDTVFKVALSPDGQTIYYSRPAGRVRRTMVRNFGQR